MRSAEAPGLAEPGSGWIVTYSGRRFWPLEPRIKDVAAEDIAHALALLNRFGGHSRVPLSVAQHSLFVAQQVPAMLKLPALLHDAAEAYLVDVPSPLKRTLPGYAWAERGVAAVIAEAFSVDPELLEHPVIKDADRRALATELRDLCCRPTAAWDWGGAPPYPETISPWPWQEAKRLFLRELEQQLQVWRP